MTAAQSAPQQGADDAAKNAEAAKVAEAEKAAEAAKAAEAEKAKAAAAAKPKPAASTSKGLVVTGAAVVLRADDGSERYLYRGAPVDTAAFSKDSIKHAKSVGLIGPAK